VTVSPGKLSILEAYLLTLQVFVIPLLGIQGTFLDTGLNLSKNLTNFKVARGVARLAGKSPDSWGDFFRPAKSRGKSVWGSCFFRITSRITTVHAKGAGGRGHFCHQCQFVFWAGTKWWTGPGKPVAEELHFLGECCETQDQSFWDRFFLWILVLRRGGPVLGLRVAEDSELYDPTLDETADRSSGRGKG